MKPYDGFKFSHPRDCPATVYGAPDFALSRDNSFLAPVEVKGKWSVPSVSNIRAQYESNHYVSGAVNQLFSYLLLNHRNSGILTNYEMTWFFKRVKDNGEEFLYVSEGIAYDGSTPSVLECISYFIHSVASNTFFESPPGSRSSTPMQLRNSSSQKMINSPLNQSFSADDLNAGKKIGEGRTGNVYMGDSDTTALKTLDLSKNRRCIDEIQNEIKIYSLLHPLQGKVIPNFRYCGVVEGILFVLGLDFVGEIPRHLSIHQKEELLRGLSEIHSYGVMHNDIRVENIVVDSTGKPFIIDFALASVTHDSYKLNVEFEEFRRLVDSL